MWNSENLLYFCLSTGEIIGNLTIIEDISGEHLSGKGDEVIEVFYERGQKLQFIPSNLADFFPNLKGFFCTRHFCELLRAT